METIFKILLIDDENPDKTITNILKIICILVVLCVTLFFGYYPLML